MTQITDAQQAAIYGRFMAVIAAREISPSDLARATATTTATVVQWLHENQLPKPQRLARFCLAYGVNGHWLLTGHGPLQAVGAGKGKEDALFNDGARAALTELRRHLREMEERFA